MDKKQGSTVSADPFQTDDDDKRSAMMTVLHSENERLLKEYSIDCTFKPESRPTFKTAHTVTEAIAAASANPDIGLEGRIFGFKEGKPHVERMGKQKILESWAKNESNYSFQEGFSGDAFATDGFNSNGAAGNQVGNDFVPLLGGPFFKQLYLYDFLSMFQLCFYAYHHDPVANAIIKMTRDFVLGRGFRVDSANTIALTAWRAFEEANDLQKLMDRVCTESAIYGETMLWKLPFNLTKITYDLGPNQKPPTGIIPRVRLLDPSTVWEIITYPEDIERPIAYQQVFPTQYQIYSAKDQGDIVPSTKFIFQQIPADEIMHYKLNAVSNEKRGRSDLFPILGYLKRLRDSVNYQIIGLQKTSAWCMDTTVSGSQDDINQYIQEQQNIGTIAPAGSEFVHSDAVKREYMSIAGSHGSKSDTFEWCAGMIASGSGFPASYIFSHLAGGSTRASALVATEPVAKKIQTRQLFLENIIRDLWNWVMGYYGIKDADCEVTFPEVIVQDRSAKLKDLALAEQLKWINHKRASTIAAKELGITDYEYEEEKKEIKEETPEEAPAIVDPLSSPGLDSGGPSMSAKNKPSAVTSEDKRDIGMNYGA